MKKICVVDDNRRELNSTVAILEKTTALSEKSIISFSNGKDAFSYIKENGADLLITDIQMPKMTGIELIKMLRDENIELPAIVVSCYDDFKYAQEAIALEAVAYVLKPIIETELNEALLRALKKKSTRVKEFESVFDTESKFYEESLKSLVMDNVGNISELLKGKTDYMVRTAIFRIDELSYCETPQVDSLSGIGEIIRSMSEEKCEFYSVITSKKTVAAAIVYSCEELLKNKLHSVLEKISEDFGFAARAGVSDVKDASAGMDELYAQAQAALKETVLCRNAPLIFFEQRINLKQSGIDTISLTDIQKELRDVLKQNSSDAITAFLEKYIVADVRYNMGYIKNFSFCVINSLEMLLNENCASFDDLFGNYIVWEKLDSFEDIVSIYNFLKNMIDGALKIIEESSFDKNSAIISRVKEIIAQKYGSRLTVKTIADEIGFSAKHTQRIFMKATGTTILNYLTLYRVERAKEKLRLGGKISVTSEEVGYKNKAHFCNIFKEYTGLSPAEYKMKNSGV